LNGIVEFNKILHTADLILFDNKRRKKRTTDRSYAYVKLSHSV